MSRKKRNVSGLVMEMFICVMECCFALNCLCVCV